MQRSDLTIIQKRKCRRTGGILKYEKNMLNLYCGFEMTFLKQNAAEGKFAREEK